MTGPSRSGGAARRSAARRPALLCLLAGFFACSAPSRYAQTATRPALSDAATTAVDAGSPRDASVRDAGNPCPTSLAKRITVTHIDLDVAIRYKRPGPDNFPYDERIALGVAGNGTGYLGWIDDAGGRVRITPLDATLSRRAPDIVVPGADIGGIVARDDGFALLTRRADPGDPAVDSQNPAPAAMLVRYRNNVQSFAVPLTGTASITHDAAPNARDCAPWLYSRLAWNGAKYGAYLIVRACSGDPHEPGMGDKLVYADDRGNYLRGGWSWNCSLNQGLRMVPEPDVFTTVCLSDSMPFPGLNLVVDGKPPRQLAPEMVANNVTAGQFGSIVKLGDGSYAIGWLSRGTVDPKAARPLALKKDPDMALIRLAADYSTIFEQKWLRETPMVAEINMHLAPYGTDRVLVIWDTIEMVRCNDFLCYGNYTGTHAGLLDLDGNFVMPDVRIDSVPNTAEDLVVLPNGDVAFASVTEDARSYANPLQLNSSTGAPRAPTKRRIDIARLRYCE